MAEQSLGNGAAEAGHARGRLEVVAPQDEQVAVSLRDDVGIARLIQDERHLADEIPRAKANRRIADRDIDGTRSYEVHPIARFAGDVPMLTLPRLAHAAEASPAIDRLTELLDRF